MPVASQTQRSLNKMSGRTVLPGPSCAGAGGWEEPGRRPALWSPVSVSSPLPLPICQGLVCLFFQSRECFEKILEINPQLETQVTGESAPADALPLVPGSRLPTLGPPTAAMPAAGASSVSNSNLCLPPSTAAPVGPSRQGTVSSRPQGALRCWVQRAHWS